MVAQEEFDDIEQPVTTSDLAAPESDIQEGGVEEPPQRGGFFDRLRNRVQSGRDNAKKLAPETEKPGRLKGVENVATKAKEHKIPSLAEQGLKEDLKKTAEHQAENVTKKTALRFGEKFAMREAAGSVIPVIGNIAMAVWTGLELLLDKKVMQVILYVIAVPLLLFALIFFVFAGNSASVLPSTNAQKTQGTAVAYLGGNFVLGGKITAKVYQEEKARYDRVLANIARTDSSKSTEVKRQADEILALMEQAQALSGQAKKNTTATIIEKVKALDSTLPYGRWIADAAATKVGRPSSEFNKCSPTLACASFTTTVLYEAGVPSPIRESADQVWLNPALTMITDRLNPESSALYAATKSKLQPGDIIFWGDGKGGGASILVNHVGFYIGNDQAIDNSSSDVKIEQRGAAKRGKASLYFNGAKRYGANL